MILSEPDADRATSLYLVPRKGPATLEKPHAMRSRYLTMRPRYVGLRLVALTEDDRLDLANLTHIQTMILEAGSIR